MATTAKSATAGSGLRAMAGIVRGSVGTGDHRVPAFSSYRPVAASLRPRIGIAVTTKRLRDSLRGSSQGQLQNLAQLGVAVRSKALLRYPGAYRGRDSGWQ